MTSPLAQNEVAIWYSLTREMGPDATAALSRILSEDERARASRFVFAFDRRDFIIAHALLRRTLSLYGERAHHEWRFEAGAHGKPAIVPDQAGTPPLAFNLSHTRGLVACAVARANSVGIDVEGVGGHGREPAIAARYFAADERNMLDAAPPDEYPARFTELWTLKEAYIKAVAAGLSRRLDSFAFAFEDATDLRFAVHGGHDDDRCEFLVAAPTPEFRLALAITSRPSIKRSHVSIHAWHRAKDPSIRMLRWTPGLTLSQQ